MAETAISIIALVISIISIAVSYYLSRRARRTSVAPVLIFSVRDNKWQLQNVGNGPALNVLVGDQDWDNRKWVEIAQLYPIAAGTTVSLDWIKHGCELAATYTDFLGHKFTSWCRNDRTEIFEENRFPKWKPTTRQRWL